jgi:hypothetical protein
MTALALLGKAKGAAAWLVARPRVALVLGVALVALLLVVAWNRARSAEERADAAEARERRAAEASRLKAAGFVVAVGRDRAEMQQQLVALLGERDGLAAEVERFRAAAQGARAVAIVRAETGTLTAAGDPRGSSCQEAPACLLAAGDQGTVQVDSVTMETRDGNKVVVGEAEVWRTSPSPRTRLFAGTFQAPVTRVSVEEPPRPRSAPRWGVGAWVGVGRDGWAVGPAVALPAARLGPLQFEAVIGGGLGPSGAFQGGASGVVRW